MRHTRLNFIYNENIERNANTIQGLKGVGNSIAKIIQGKISSIYSHSLVIEVHRHSVKWVLQSNTWQMMHVYLPETKIVREILIKRPIMRD